QVSVVAMDKTGTLTTGELQVAGVESFPPGREDEIAQLACSFERLSTHPLARAITRYGKKRGLPPVEVQGLESVAGAGLRGAVGGVAVQLGRRSWMLDLTLPLDLPAVPPPEPGFSEVWVVTSGLAGRLLLRDDLRPAARK